VGAAREASPAHNHDHGPDDHYSAAHNHGPVDDHDVHDDHGAIDDDHGASHDDVHDDHDDGGWGVVYLLASGVHAL
jgi:hypothetical protein